MPGPLPPVAQKRNASNREAPIAEPIAPGLMILYGYIIMKFLVDILLTWLPFSSVSETSHRSISTGELKTEVPSGPPNHSRRNTYCITRYALIYLYFSLKLLPRRPFKVELVLSSSFNEVPSSSPTRKLPQTPPAVHPVVRGESPRGFDIFMSWLRIDT